MATVEIERTAPTLTVTSWASAAGARTAPSVARHASTLRRSTKLIRFSLLFRLRVTALFGLDEIASLAVPIEAFLPQRVERAHDLAPVAAAHRRHEFLEELWPVRERGRHRREARALKPRRLRHAGFDPGAGAERPGQVEAGLCTGTRARERGVERQGTHAVHDHKVAVGLEPGRQRPVHLLVREDVHVRIDDEHVLDVDQRAEARGDRVARLAGNALAQRHAQVEHAAAG